MPEARDAIGQRTGRQGDLSMATERFDWIDPYPARTLPRLRQVLDAPLTHGRWYALVDMGFSPTLREALAALNPDGAVIALYEGVYDGDGLLEISPCVTPLPDDAAHRAEVCAGLLRETDGRPMLSVLRAAHGLDALVAHLRGQMEARAADDEAFLVRFADTRCVPTWAGVLTPAQRARFFCGHRCVVAVRSRGFACRARCRARGQRDRDGGRRRRAVSPRRRADCRAQARVEDRHAAFSRAPAAGKLRTIDGDALAGLRVRERSVGEGGRAAVGGRAAGARCARGGGMARAGRSVGLGGAGGT